VSSKFDGHLMATAGVWATASQAQRKQVGAVISKDHRIIATGFNGTLPGLPNHCEDVNGETLPTVMHAEANAILFAAKHGLALQGCTLYTTLSPCMQCAKMVAASGITRLVYYQAHSDQSGVHLLADLGVLCDQLSEDIIIDAIKADS